MEVKLFQVDAFTNKVFKGNPAAVCPLEYWLDDVTLTNIAAENNLSETAYIVPKGDLFELRWFTPTAEVDLCGHATLAAAHVLFEKLGYKGDRVRFTTKSGELTVSKQKDLLSLNFPSRPGELVECPAELIMGLGATPKEVYYARDYMAVFQSEEEILALKPDFAALAKLDGLGVIATAKGENSDFVSRAFFPKVGVPEDPVTGSAHCTLTPYWSKRLGKTKLCAQQVSKRGGELWCHDLGERVEIAGHAALYLEGVIRLPSE